MAMGTGAATATATATATGTNRMDARKPRQAGKELRRVAGDRAHQPVVARLKRLLESNRLPGPDILRLSDQRAPGYRVAVQVATTIYGERVDRLPIVPDVEPHVAAGESFQRFPFLRSNAPLGQHKGYAIWRGRHDLEGDRLLSLLATNALGGHNQHILPHVAHLIPGGKGLPVQLGADAGVGVGIVTGAVGDRQRARRFLPLADAPTMISGPPSPHAAATTRMAPISAKNRSARTTVHLLV